MRPALKVHRVGKVLKAIKAHRAIKDHRVLRAIKGQRVLPGRRVRRGRKEIKVCKVSKAVRDFKDCKVLKGRRAIRAVRAVKATKVRQVHKAVKAFKVTTATKATQSVLPALRTPPDTWELPVPVLQPAARLPWATSSLTIRQPFGFAPPQVLLVFGLPQSSQALWCARQLLPQVKANSPSTEPLVHQGRPSPCQQVRRMVRSIRSRTSALTPSTSSAARSRSAFQERSTEPQLLTQCQRTARTPLSTRVEFGIAWSLQTLPLWGTFSRQLPVELDSAPLEPQGKHSWSTLVLPD